MKTPDHRYFEEKPEIRPDGVRDGLEELGLLVAIAVSSIMLVIIALVVSGMYL